MPRRPIEILHLAYSPYPADTRVKREVRALRAADCRIAVIALRGEGERAIERRDGAITIRVPGRKSRGGMLSYLLEYGDFVWRCRRLVQRHRALAHVRIVHVHTLPDFLLWAALPAQRRGARVIFDMHEIFPEFAGAKFGGLLGSLIAAAARRIERWARRRADLTITVNRPIDDLLASRPASNTERRIIIHNTADPADFGDAPPPGPRPLTAPLQLAYHGTLTHLYGRDIAIRAVSRASKAGFDVKLAIIGDGPERGRLEELARATAQPGAIQFERPLPQRALADRLQRCHAGVVPTRLDAMTRYSLSTKLLEYAHLGIPVLAARLPSYQLYFGENTLWFWTPGDAGDLAVVIAAFVRASPQERAARAARARCLLEPLAWPEQSRVLRAAYAELLAQGDQKADRIAAIRSAAVPSP
jgi:glycosyltransferase involved in cell wall biosynthesis